MASTASNVFAAQPSAAGALRNAPLGTTGPTDATTALNAAFIDLGYLGEDGITESISRDTEKKKAFGGATVKVLQTEFGNTFQFVFMEHLNADVLKRVYGESNVTVGADGLVSVTKNKKTLPRESWVIDVYDDANIDRTYIPEGQIIEIGDIVRVHSDTIAYEVTIEGFEDVHGNTSYNHLYVAALDTP